LRSRRTKLYFFLLSAPIKNIGYSRLWLVVDAPSLKCRAIAENFDLIIQKISCNNSENDGVTNRIINQKSQQLRQDRKA
jgi:hypothetical protein